MSDTHRREMVIVLDFGAQYSQLIARAIREKNVYCEIHPYNLSLERIMELKPAGMVLSGGPASVYDHEAPKVDHRLFELRIPTLGICYGMQLMAHSLGGEVMPSHKREYGYADLYVKRNSNLFENLGEQLGVWMSHGDQVGKLPSGFEIIAHTHNTPIAAMGDPKKKFFGVQFHPEVMHTPKGKEIIANFLYNVCGCSPSWNMKSFVKTAVDDINSKVASGRVLCATSGGVDSSVLSALLKLAVGDRLTCVFVNNGLLRKNEAESVIHNFKRFMGMNLHYIEASDRFLERLKGVLDPEEKRKIIGEEFIRVFEAELDKDKLGKIDFLAQGTLYPDVIESISVKGPSATIKTHHNVGGLPKSIQFKLIEPFRELFKDEVRAVGAELGLPPDILGRHPFPGPGLAIRVIGEVTEERLDILRQADAIYIEEIKKSGVYDQIWQAFAVLLPVRSVGVMGDFRTYENVVALRAVTSRDGMTADWAQLQHELLAKISNRIINEVRGINRVVYDISSKPPSTIEWE